MNMEILTVLKLKGAPPRCFQMIVDIVVRCHNLLTKSESFF